MKDPVFLSSPIYPPFISCKPSFSTTRDDHLLPLLSLDDFIFKAQLTSLYMHPTDYSFRLYDKTQEFFHIYSFKNNGSIPILAGQWRQNLFSVIQLSLPINIRFKNRRI